MTDNIPLSANKTLRVVNFFGGPGCGKSTLAADVFAAMKRRGYNVELVHEIAKDFTWENSGQLLYEQDYIFALQHRLQRRLVGKGVDFVITDSPLLLGLVYASDEFSTSFRQFVLDMFGTYDNYNFLVQRSQSRTYDPIGRNQTEQEAVIKDHHIVNLLTQNDIDFMTISTHNDTSSTVDQIISTLDFALTGKIPNMPHLALQHYQWIDDMGWHNNRTTLEALAMIASEVGEVLACCEDRSSKSADYGEELADVLLRCIDLSIALCVPLEEVSAASIVVEKSTPFDMAASLMVDYAKLVNLYRSNDSDSYLGIELQRFMSQILSIAAVHAKDLPARIVSKMEKNLSRGNRGRII